VLCVGTRFGLKEMDDSHEDHPSSSYYSFHASTCFAQDTTKDERNANRERVKAEQQLLNQQAKEEKNRAPEPENSIASILQRHPIQDVPVIQNADPAKLYDIKGDRLGMTLEEYGKAHYSFFPGDRKSKVSPSIGPYCKDHDDSLSFLTKDEAAAGVASCANYPILIGTPTTVANMPMTGIAFKFFKGHMFDVIAVFKEGDYATVKAAFVGKFGAPTSSHVNQVQNRMGAKFDDETLTWSNGVSAIELRQRASDLDTSAFSIYIPKMLEEVQALLPKPKKDL
jgi:hypothetical protein